MSTLQWYRSMLCEEYGDELTSRVLDDPAFAGFVGEVHALEGGELEGVACEVAYHAVDHLYEHPEDSANDAYAELRRRMRG
ncbi:hypothetical protein ACFYVL_01550 [Streptomyces sp. NPDC004111]|uniref:hypothetical protein n=1 Tax=Streptomyces sp. NPDC004111 TaxID=3364690 RepID=UPI00367AD546